MNRTQTKETAALKDRECQTCNKETPPLERAEAERLHKQIKAWKLDAEGKSLRREYEVRDFAAGVEFINRVAAIAEDQDHHPDVHITNYRELTIVLTTHAIKGLSENDFILAAKIDELPVALKRRANG
jgi:4a-hydroxytetrahydrobiopterin dehydratase